MARRSLILCFLALCFSSTQGQTTAEPDPCLSGNYNKLDQPDRSTAIRMQQGDAGRSDENLGKGWYAFVSGAGGEIPTSPPETGACSSKKPIWLNGTQPLLDGKIHDLEMCYYLNKFDTCGIQIQIRAKRCLHRVVYELLPTSSANSSQQITDASYCAGEQEPCPAGLTSLTGFTPNCYVAPTVGDKPVIPDPVPLSDTFEFHCELTNPLPNAAYKLIWEVDGEFVSEDELQIGQTVSKLSERKLIQSGVKIMGRNLTCSARGRYLNDAAHKWGAAKSSVPYFMGIEVSDASGVALHRMSWTLTLPESEEHQIFSVRSTIPLRCDPYNLQAGTECKIEIAIRNDNSMENKPLRCRNGVIEQLKLAKCSVTITPANWWMPQPIAIKATKDFKYDGNRPRVVEFKMTDGPGRSIWDGYIPHQIQVLTEDFIDKRAQCVSVNDPHMTTFDGHKWHNYYEGEFILYRHKELPFEVRAFYKRCGGASCNCAVAARAGDDVIIVDRCNSMGDIKIWGSDKKVSYNLLRTRTISTDDIIAPNFQIFALNGGKEYRIYFPHGAMLRAQLTGGGHAQFMNLWLSPSPADFNRVEGMCGNFNGDKTEDLRMRNGSLYSGAGSANGQHPREFSKHWRVVEGESIYNGNVPATASTYQKEYCSCVKSVGAAFDYLDCQLNSDSARCDQTGEDITAKNFEYQAQNSPKNKPFDFDADWTPPVLDWPTPSGWTKANATQFCEDFLMQSEAFKQCNLTIDDDLEMCVEDIKLSDGVEFAMTALDNLKEKCLSEWNKDTDALIPDDAFCFNECSMQGDCRNGVCYCHSGFAGDDCSLSKSAIPDVLFAPFCDVSTEQCGNAEIYGNGFIKSDDLICTYQPAEISEGSLVIKGPRQQTKASYENFAEVRCPVGGSRSKRSGGAAGSTTLPGQAAVSVANAPGAKSSNIILYTMYDSRCQTCDFKTGECQVKANMCQIEGHCYTHGDVSPGDEKASCDSLFSQNTWYRDSALPHWAIGVIAASSTLALVSFVLIIYMKVIRKRTKVIA